MAPFAEVLWGQRLVGDTPLVVLACVASYSLCWTAQIPLLPYLLRSMGVAGDRTYTALQTALSCAQLVGSLLSGMRVGCGATLGAMWDQFSPAAGMQPPLYTGPLADRFGPRLLLLISLWASAASYALTASASTVAALYLSRWLSTTRGD